MNNYLKAQYEQFQQGMDKLKTMSPAQQKQQRLDAFQTAQKATDQRNLAMDPNKSKILDPFTRSEMIQAPNKPAVDAWTDLHTNMDAYAGAADDRRDRLAKKKSTDSATVNYTNPGTGDIASPTTPSPTVRKTTPRTGGSLRGLSY